MANRGYKLQEFVAHSANVNCLSLAKKSCRLLVTGGDDHKVNLWAVGKPTSLMSLCGHTSPVQSVVFDAEEVLVLAGSTSGVIKLWDLEETKMVRGLTGHRSNCTAVQFHPFGEFFASGSMDTNLKIWDIRKKGCIHTYKGHTGGIGTIRFTPDGRWVVSGGLDNVVKVWDLTAGKLLHDFKFHEGHIRSLDFHPLEFLLATGSADRTVKFWDLETFELIGSSRPEATGVCSVAFHPDGRTLFSGLEDGLKVYSWEPVVCHDSVDIGWSTLGDLCISEGKVLGCSYYQDSIGIWVEDTSHIEPYGASCTLEQNDSNNRKLNILENHASLKAGSGIRSATRLWSPSPEFETKEIKNIYVDTAAGDHAALRRVSSLNSPKFVMPEDSDEISKQPAEKQDLCSINSSEDSVNKTFLPSNVVPRDSPVGKEISNSPRESITFSRTKPGMLLRPAHTRRATNKSEVEKLPKEVQCLAASNIKSKVDDGVDLDGQVRPLSGGEPRKSCEDKELNMTSIVEKSQCTLLPPTSPNQEIYAKSLNTSQDVNSVKVVRGVAIVSGRTRSLVERFERREKLNSCEEQPVNSITHVMPETDMRPTIMFLEEKNHKQKEETQISESPLNSASDVDASRDQNSSMSSSAGGGEISDGQISKGEPMPVASGYMCPISERESFSSSGRIPSNSASDVDANRDHNSRITSSSAGTGRVSGSQISKESTPAAGGYVTKNPMSERESFSSSGRSPSNSASDVDSSREQNSRITSSSAEIGRISGSQIFKESTPAGGGYVARSHISERQSFSSSGRSPSNSASDVDASREQTSRRTSSFGRTGKISGSQILKGELTPARGGYITVSRISERESLSSSGRNSKITGSQNFIKHQRSRSLSASGGNWKTIGDQNSKTGSVAASGILDASPVSEEDSFSYSGRSIDMIESQSFTGESDASNNCNIITTESEVLGKKSVCPTDRDIMETLMRTHDVCLSTFRSRLTKLQVVRHFWEKSDVKGAINALQKLPDHSVQADVISVLMEKMEIFTLNLFPCLLPVLTGLLDSTMERHVSVSLEMLLKLVPVFGPVIRSTLSARRGVGVDLHAEERRKWCKQCSIHLQKIQKILPAIIRRGGSISRNAEELNLVLQES